MAAIVSSSCSVSLSSDKGAAIGDSSSSSSSDGLLRLKDDFGLNLRLDGISAEESNVGACSVVLVLVVKPEVAGFLITGILGGTLALVVDGLRVVVVVVVLVVDDDEIL